MGKKVSASNESNNRIGQETQVFKTGAIYKAITAVKLAQSLDRWLRRRIRMCFWKQWKRIITRYNNLVRLGIDNYKSWEFANTRKGYWRTSNSPILSRTITNEYLKKSGFPSIVERYSFVH